MVFFLAFKNFTPFKFFISIPFNTDTNVAHNAVFRNLWHQLSSFLSLHIGRDSKKVYPFLHPLSFQLDYNVNQFIFPPFRDRNKVQVSLSKQRIFIRLFQDSGS